MATATQQLLGGSLRDFSGGPNLRDDGPKLAANELADAFNITLDERGGVSSRLGYIKQNATVFGTTGDRVISMFWSSLLAGKRITQAGTKLYLDDTNTARHTFTTDDTVTFCETNAAVCALHPVDGLFTSTDGITWTAVTAAPAGTCIAAWENGIYIGQTNGKLSWSDNTTPDITSWPATNFVELWERDQQGLVALHVGSGQDIQGRPGLLVFKNDSFYRVNDPVTGSYSTVDASVGAAGPLAVVGVGARVCFIGKHGVYWWREDQAQAVNASDRLLPLWQRSQLALAEIGQWRAGRSRDRALFSLTRNGSTVNDLALELHPDLGWIVPRSDAMACYATSNGTDETVYGGSPTVDGQCYQLGVGGSDDGAAIDFRMQTRWIELNGGFQSSLWQVRLHGRGAGTMTIRIDYQTTGGRDRPFNLVADDGPMFDSGVLYDSGVQYAAESLQQTQPHYSIGTCRQFSLLFTGSSTDTAAGQQVFGQGTPPDVGYFALTGLEYLHAPLGLS